MLLKYEDVVLADYHQKKVTNALRLRLSDPSPARLRDECITVLYERYSVKDLKILSEFFELKHDESISEQVIKRFDIDRFRPLIKFLKGETGTTDPINVELLAWLIDFQPRPNDFRNQYQVKSPSEQNTDPVIDSQNGEQHVQTSAAASGTIEKSGNELLIQQTKIKLKGIKVEIIVIGSVSVLLLVTMMIYIFSGDGSCMYWAGDHYERISCIQHGDTLVVAADEERLNNLKRITDLATITPNDIGKVWYIKRNNKLEFYTSGGYYPEDPGLMLRPMTAYIYKKYIQEGQVPDERSQIK